MKDRKRKSERERNRERDRERERNRERDRERERNGPSQGEGIVQQHGPLPGIEHVMVSYELLRQVAPVVRVVVYPVQSLAADIPDKPGRVGEVSHTLPLLAVSQPH